MIYSLKSAFIVLSMCFSLIHACGEKKGKTGNPYIDAKERPSDKQRKEERAQMRVGEKAYKKQIKRNKKEIQGNINDATDPKAKYKSITKQKRNRKKYDFKF